MSKLPAGWALVTVTANYADIIGAAPVGDVLFVADQAVVIDGVVVVPKTVRVPLVDGAISVELPSNTDPALAIKGWAWTVRERFDMGRPEYRIFLPPTGTYDLAAADTTGATWPPVRTIGLPGPPNVITPGTVEMLAPDAEPQMLLTGDAPVQVLNLKLPRGLTGDVTQAALDANTAAQAAAASAESQATAAAEQAVAAQESAHASAAAVGALSDDLDSAADGKGAAKVAFLQFGDGAGKRSLRDKGRDELSIRDFSCSDLVLVGTVPGHDDTTGIQAALNTGVANIVVPPGQYLCATTNGAVAGKKFILKMTTDGQKLLGRGGELIQGVADTVFIEMAGNDQTIDHLNLSDPSAYSRTSTTDSFYGGRRGAISVSGKRNRVTFNRLTGFRDNIHVSHSGTSQTASVPEDTLVSNNTLVDVRGSIAASQTTSFGIYDFGDRTKILDNRVFAKSGDTYLLHGIKSEQIATRRKDGTTDGRGALHSGNTVIGPFASPLYIEGVARSVSCYNFSQGCSTATLEMNSTDGLCFGNILYAPDPSANWDGTAMAALKHSNGRNCRFRDNIIVVQTSTSNTSNGLVLVTNGPILWKFTDNIIASGDEYAFKATLSDITGSFTASSNPVSNTAAFQALRCLAFDSGAGVVTLSQSQGGFAVGDVLTQATTGATGTVSALNYTKGSWLRAFNIASGVTDGVIRDNHIHTGTCSVGVYAFAVSRLTVDRNIVETPATYGVQLVNSGDANIVRNNTIRNAGSDGINCANQTNLTVVGNGTKACGGYGRKFSACGLLALDLNTDVGSTSGVESRISGTTIVGRASKSYNPPSVAAGAQSATTTLTIPGAVLGDGVAASFSLDMQDTQLVAWISAADTMSAFIRNGTASAVDLGAGVLSGRIVKQ